MLVNPILRFISGDRDTEDEGCLSVPGFHWPTRRAHTVHVTGLDALGHPVQIEASGYLARCFQHEIDHLDGRLYLSRLDSRTAAAPDTWPPAPTGTAPTPSGSTSPNR